nr:Cytochrome P450 [Sitophilus oryzae]
MFTVCTFILLCLAYILTYMYLKKKFQYWQDRNVAFVAPNMILGNLYSLLSLKRSPGHWLMDHYKRFGTNYFGLFAFTKPILVIKSPKIIKDILIKDFSYFDNRTATVSTHDKIMSNMLFTKQNPAWKKVRSKVTPLFSSGKLRLMFTPILAQAEHMVRNVRLLVSCQESIEIKEICTKYSTNVIAKCAFSVDARTFENDKAEFREIGRCLFDSRLENRLRFFAARFLPSLVKSFNIFLVRPTVSETLRNIFTTIFDVRKKSRKSKDNDLIDILLRIEDYHKDDKDFGAESLLGAAVNFFAAGFETVATTMAFVLYELCIAPEIQTKLRDEIASNVEKNRGLVYENMNEMKYLDMVVCETLRKYPVLPFLDRMCNSAYKIPNTDLVVEQGTVVYVPLFGLHYDEIYFPNPEKFIPERFEHKCEINNDGLYYLPFGEGPRNCIGTRFGLMTLKVGIIQMLLNFELKPSANTPIPLIYDPKAIIVSSKVGLPMKVLPLN